ncbi:MAG TPA: succinylglutamate desuccinylase/aspartoacylase family protein [Polyangiaceae bacterium]|nr:succinylglutamate desuccinylase/aspartoacylase family protein [Polyangiaceae bacterium]
MIRPHPTISAAWELSGDGSFTGPWVGVIGALHGNEVAGLEVIESIKTDADGFAKRLKRGTVVLVHGNPKATEEGRRYSKGGTDINRLFAYQWIEELAPEAWAYEHHRALELRPLMTGLDAMVDLHSASQPTVPFAICDGRPEGIALSQKTGCKVTFGWDGPGMLMEHVSIGALVAKGRPAISVECGQHKGADTAKVAHDVLTRFLGGLGLSDHATAETAAESYELFGRLVKPTLHFELERDFASFDRLLAGSVLGHGDGVTVSVDRDAFLLLPTPKAVRGEDIVYLAHEVS